MKKYIDIIRKAIGQAARKLTPVAVALVGIFVLALSVPTASAQEHYITALIKGLPAKAIDSTTNNMLLITNTAISTNATTSYLYTNSIAVATQGRTNLLMSATFYGMMSNVLNFSFNFAGSGDGSSYGTADILTVSMPVADASGTASNAIVNLPAVIPPGLKYLKLRSIGYPAGPATNYLVISNLCIGYWK